jgi:hypothetical protein
MTSEMVFYTEDEIHDCKCATYADALTKMHCEYPKQPNEKDQDYAVRIGLLTNTDPHADNKMIHISSIALEVVERVCRESRGMADLTQLHPNVRVLLDMIIFTTPHIVRIIDGWGVVGKLTTWKDFFKLMPDDSVQKIFLFNIFFPLAMQESVDYSSVFSIDELYELFCISSE